MNILLFHFLRYIFIFGLTLQSHFFSYRSDLYCINFDDVIIDMKKLFLEPRFPDIDFAIPISGWIFSSPFT